MGRLIAEDRPDGAQVDYSYDANGNVTAILNPNNIEHGFSYTANDQRESYNTPESGSYVYQYDRDRRLTSVMYPSGATITNTWATGQLQSTSTPEGLISYGYDCGGKLGSVSKGGESSFYTYDGSLLLIDTRAGTMNALIDYTYNSDLQVDSIGYAGASESFLYDGDGLLTDAGAYSITRDAPNGLPESVTDGTVTQARDFSSYGEVDGVDYTVGATAAYSWSVVRDNTGRITQKVENIGVDTVTWDYTYDLRGRLETVYKDSIMAEAYSYDGQGNRLEETNVLRGVSRTYTHDDEDKIVWAGLDAYMYDVDGFLTSRSIAAGADSGITTFDYSSRGELLSATLPDATVISYDHDPMGRRLAKRINGTITEKYLWQDAITLLAVYDGSDNLLQRFEYADGRMPVAMTSGGAVYYLAYDQVGSLKVVTDAAGTVVKRVDYDSFGNILNGSNSTFTVPFGFAGGLHDRDTGLVRFGARDYDSATGKWTAKDPIDFVGGDLNLLSYVGQDPVNWVDPLGLKIDWGNQVLSNLRLQANLVRLNQTIINLGYDDNCFTITLAGGDRQYGPNRKGWMFPDYLNNAWSVSTNKRVIQSHPYSAHFVDWGARSVDIALIGVRDTTFNMALLATEFDPKRTITYKDGHVHISLPKGKEYWAENYRYPVY